MIKTLNSNFLILDDEYFCYNTDLKIFTYMSNGGIFKNEQYTITDILDLEELREMFECYRDESEEFNNWFSNLEF